MQSKLHLVRGTSGLQYPQVILSALFSSPQYIPTSVRNIWQRCFYSLLAFISCGSEPCHHLSCINVKAKELPREPRVDFWESPEGKCRWTNHSLTPWVSAVCWDSSWILQGRSLIVECEFFPLILKLLYFLLNENLRSARALDSIFYAWTLQRQADRLQSVSPLLLHLCWHWIYLHLRRRRRGREENKCTKLKWMVLDS